MIKNLGLLLILIFTIKLGYRLPINALEKKSVSSLKLTKIGKFGLLRKERPKVAAHYHTGIDIKRPTNNYESEPIFPISEGLVISKREDGPYAQLIIEHGDTYKFWTVYEHIAGIEVNLFDHVNTDTKIARFMNRKELNKYGWQFDHFHFEVLKVQPFKLKRNNLKPERLFSSYTLVAYTREDLNKYFYDPLDFLEKHLN